jgi:nucleotidyltransferase/DNA polymerase involved in DNA repair
MPSVTAKRRCPGLIFVTPRFDVYKAVSLQIQEIFAEYTPIIEPLSLDKYFDTIDHAHLRQFLDQADTLLVAQRPYVGGDGPEIGMRELSAAHGRHMYPSQFGASRARDCRVCKEGFILQKATA